MARLAVVLLLALTACTHAAPPVRVLIDPALDAEAGRHELVHEARRCLDELRALISRPAARLHFVQHYGLNPVRLLERDDFAVIVRAFPDSVAVGGYAFGETTLDLNVAVLRAARHASDPRPWRRYAAGLLVHELAHLADFIGDGVNDDGGLIDAEEGEAAQKAAGCDLLPPGPLPSESLTRR